MFQSGEEIVLYRPPGVLDKWRTYDGFRTISKTKDWKKTIIKNIENDFIYRTNELSDPKKSIGDTNKWFEFPEIWFERRSREYLKNNSTMDENTFKKYFSVRALDMNDGQKNIWNCYLVAALRSLMESPNYETLIRTSIRIDISKWPNNWVADVKLPLWDPKSKLYKIYASEIKPQKNIFYNPDQVINPQTVPLQRVKWRDGKYEAQLKTIGGKRTPEIMTKEHEYLNPLEWPIWMQILEMAYLKKETRTNNDLWEWGTDRLKMEWWFWDRAIIDLIWENNWKPERVWSYWYKNIIDQGESSKTKAYEYFNNFHSFRDYGTLASIAKRWMTDSNMYNIDNQKIAYGHAYTIIDTNPINQTVQIINPRKTNQTFTLTYEQTVKAFSSITNVWVAFDKAFR